MDRRTSLHVKSVSHAFGRNKVLCDVNIDIGAGQIVSLVGPSGCGKSTLLRAIVGTHLPEEGQIVVYSGQNHETGNVVHSPGRDRGIVYQRYSLFPFLTAQQNVAFGLLLDDTSLPFRFFRPLKWRKLRKAHLKTAAEFLEKVGLQEATNLYPSEMSGGMCQRVAIAQALITKPEILLLDEPFGALDEAMREELQRMLLTLYAENCEAVAEGKKAPYTILIVTHELNEAIYVGDRVIGLSQYWDWQSEGFACHPGATVVYDQRAPVFRPDDMRDMECFREQRESIRRLVFDPDVREERGKSRTFWNEIDAGHGEGIYK